MNWRLEATAREGELPAERFVFLDTEFATDESGEPTAALVDAARTAATLLARALGTDDAHVTIQAHETTNGDSFRPAHIAVTASRLSPPPPPGAAPSGLGHPETRRGS